MAQQTLEFLSRNEVLAAGLSALAFLVLFWLIRGAPVGQRPTGDGALAPVAGYRDRVVAASIVGFLLVLLGAFIAATRGVPWSLPVFAGGFGLILVVQRINETHRHHSPTLRRVGAFTTTAMNASLLAGILVVVNSIAFRFGGSPIDLTHDQAFSLSSQTTQFLKALDQPLHFTAFYGRSPSSRIQLDRIRQLLTLYQNARPDRVKVDYLNQFESLGEFQELLKVVPDVAASNGDGVVIEFGAGDAIKRALVTNLELFSVAREASATTRRDRYSSTFQGEDVLTSSLIRLAEGKTSRIGFTYGHGEVAIGENSTEREGTGFLRSRILTTGGTPVELDLIRFDVPADVKLVIIVGPKSPFQAAELAKIRAFLERGGRLLLALDGSSRTGLEDLLKTFNIELLTGTVVDPSYNLNGNPEFLLAPLPRTKNHPVVDTLGGQSVLLASAAPIRILGTGGASTLESSANPGVQTVPILQSSPNSWVEADLAKRPISREVAREAGGPVTVGVAASERSQDGKTEPVPRVVLFSTRFMAENAFVERWPANMDVLMNAIYWLRGKPELLGIAPKTHITPLFVADAGLKARLVLVPTSLAVVLIIGLGLTTYLSRRDS